MSAQDRPRTRRDDLRYLLAGAALAGAALCSAAPAHAQFIHRLYLHGELGVGTMLNDNATQNLRYDGLGMEGTLRLGIRLTGPLSVQVGVANWFWFRDPGSTGRLLSVDFGLRAEARNAGPGTLWADLNVGPGFTGDLTRLHANLGLGYDFHVARNVRLGPFARLGLVAQENDTSQSAAANENALFWAAGLNVTVHFPEDPPPPPPPGPADRDGDGVLDPDDQCVDVPQGPNPDPARRGCPLGDRDGDGVLDPEDQCPDFPMGDEPDPDRRGCPDNDNDGDGITDHRDQCPLEPMDPRPDPERIGCRRPESVINLGEILFERGSAVIIDNEQNNRTLNQAQALFSAHNEIQLFSVEGHTDERDSDRHNLQLSQARAESVRDWLAGHGIDTARMVPAGYGEFCPVDPGHTEEAWARNRRVVFVIARRGGSPEPNAVFGCPAASRYVPESLRGSAPETGRHRRHHRRHRRHGGHR